MYLGIDASCYTTSAAVVDERGAVVWDRRIPLKVKENGRGLRQSEMVFQHVKNLPLVMPCGIENFHAVGVSAAPRPQEGSYMPVFAVSESYGRAIGAVAGMRVIELTHQHGHIGAAMIGCEPQDGKFLAMHVSGGTTELLSVEKSGGIIGKIEKLGGTTDIAAGQLIDRIGVYMGMAFPAGQAMEEIAEKGDIALKVSCRDREASFSGAETAVRRLLEKGASKPHVAYAIEECIANTLIRLADSAVKQYGKRELLLCGGVMRNAHICRMVREQAGTRVILAGKEYSSDNACGIAAQARLIDRNRGDQ